MIIEITVRRFFTCDEADVSPSATVLVSPDGSARLPDWDRLIEQLIGGLPQSLADGPFTNVREMTMPEVEQLRLDEAAE